MKRRPPEPAVAVIDRAWLGRLRLARSELSGQYLSDFRTFFRTHRESPIFSPDLVPEDFPRKAGVKGTFGERIDRIVQSVFTRAAQVSVLKAAEDAYENGAIELPQFVFLHTAFHVYVRRSTYCRLTVSDLIVDKNPGTGNTKYFLALQLRKTRLEDSVKELREIHEELGKLLTSLRTHVIEKHGHLFRKSQEDVDAPVESPGSAYWPESDIGKLALFPAEGLDAAGMFRSSHSRTHYGECTPESLHGSYLQRILRLTDSAKFHLTGLRHTVGTQLAAAGLSAEQISPSVASRSRDSSPAALLAKPAPGQHTSRACRL